MKTTSATAIPLPLLEEDRVELPLTPTQAPISKGSFALIPALLMALLGIVGSARAQTCASLPPGLVAWWRAENNGSNFLGGNIATGISFGIGKVGQAFQFDGSNYAQVQNGGLSSSTNLTIEGWFYVEGQNDGPALAGTSPVDVGSGWNLMIAEGLKPTFGLVKGQTSENVLSAVPIALSTWAHIAATYDGTNISIFVNGGLQGLKESLGGYTPSSGPMLIGGASWCESYGCSGYKFRLTGRVDELSIYNRALTAAEIQAVYNAGSAGKCPTLTPEITTQPVDQIALAGTDVAFTVEAHGVTPFYQWFFNGTNPLPEQTNSHLRLTNLHFSQAGAYSVLVSNNFGAVLSRSAALSLSEAPDADKDGIPDHWELRYGLKPNDPSDAMQLIPGDQLTYLQKYRSGLNPLVLDTDGDGLTDYDELFIHGTNALVADTDGDGMPDAWEVPNSLNPRVNDATEDLDLDGLTNLQEYQNRTQGYRPDRAASLGDSLSDYERLFGTQTNRFYYDRSDRLIGADYNRGSNGFAIAYIYDGNGNLLRQKSLVRDANHNGLPDVWEFIHGLTNNASAYADTDADRWTDYQEWMAGTGPRANTSQPGMIENPGLNIASLQLPFTPSNFVVGVGQLDGSGAEEIVIGGDGNPGANTNFFLVLSKTSTSWSTQRVDVGAFGITSIAVGQPANRPSVGIYAGLRGPTNGSGRIVEFSQSGTTWQSNLVALSTNTAAFVLGVHDSNDVLASLATTNGADGVLYAFNFSTSWIAQAVATNTSHRGLGTVGKLAQSDRTSLRLLDSGGIGVSADSIGGSLSMKWIPGGSFIMGDSYSEGYANELPVHGVHVSAFHMDKFEVSRALWNEVYAWGLAHGYQFDTVLAGGPTNHPVNCSWFDAVKWCNARSEMSGSTPVYYTDAAQATVYRIGQIPLSNDAVKWTANGYRLPTEAEWEKAARGGAAGNHFPWTSFGGNYSAHIDGSKANYNNSGDPFDNGTTPVGYYNGSQQPPGVDMANGYGLYDMAGNVWEWCWDWLGDDWYSQAGAIQGDTHGPVAGQFRLLRGSQWGDQPSSLRCASRHRETPSIMNSTVGFRCVRVAALVEGLIVSEPSATDTLNWRGVSLAAGLLRGTNSSSIFYTFADDKNANGLIDFADDFVTAEYLLSGTNASLLTLSRQPIASPTVAQSYGLASVNFLNATNEVFFTGEPDGQVFAWTATGTNSLQRQLFSAQHAGKGWHALAAVKTFDPGAGLVGLLVDPATPNKYDVILWPPQAQLPRAASFPQTAPITRIMSAPDRGGGIAEVEVRIWDAEGNASLPMLQYFLPSGTAWLNATLVGVGAAAYGSVPVLPTGATHRLVWNAAVDLGGSFTNQVRLRARAKDVTLPGPWSDEATYQVEISVESPVAVNDSTTTPEDSPVDIVVLTNDTVAPGRTLTLTSVTQGAHGSVSINANSTVKYSPDANFFGAQTFTYTISDGAGGSSVGVVTITVIPVNDPPMISIIATQTTSKDTPTAAIAFAISDPETPAENLIVTGRSSNTSLVPDAKIVFGGGGGSRAVTITPAAGQTGRTTITVRLTDAGGLSAEQNFLLTVTAGTGGLLELVVGNAAGAQGSQVVVPVQINGFSNILTAQFSMHWNTNVAVLAGVEQFGLSGLGIGNFGTNQAINGVIIVSWDDESTDQAGVSLANGSVLFALRFNLVGSLGSSTPITIDGIPAPIELLDSQLRQVTLIPTPGLLTVANTVRIAGAVKYYSRANVVPGVVLNLTSDQPQTATTAGDGAFAFVVGTGGNYSVTPSKTTDSPPSLGVTTLDITLMRRQILGIAGLDSPYKLLAADVNNSSNVTTLDITLIRRVILGITNTFPAGQWKFVRSDFGFANPLLPWVYEPTRTYTGLVDELVNQDFVAIKLGDVNTSWMPPAVVGPNSLEASGKKTDAISSTAIAKHSTTSKTPKANNPMERNLSLPTSRLALIAGSASVAPGRSVKIPVSTSGFTQATSLQFTLRWDASVLQWVGMSDFGLPGLAAENFHTGGAAEGRLAFSWDDPNATGVTVADGTALFHVEFKAVSQGTSKSMIEFQDSPTLREVTVNFAAAPFMWESGQVIVEAESKRSGVSVEVVPQLSMRGGEGLVLRGEAGATYRIEYTERLSTGSQWKTLTTLKLVGDLERVVPIERAGSHQRFYRAVLVQ